MNKQIKKWIDLTKIEKEKLWYAFAHPICPLCERKVQSYAVNEDSICWDCVEASSNISLDFIVNGQHKV